MQVNVPACKDGCMDNAHIVRELIEPLTKILANTYLLQTRNLDGIYSNRLL